MVTREAFPDLFLTSQEKAQNLISICFRHYPHDGPTVTTSIEEDPKLSTDFSAFVRDNQHVTGVNECRGLETQRFRASTLGFTTASSGATGRSAHAMVDKSFVHISRHR